jgi:hypothetical protein
MKIFRLLFFLLFFGLTANAQEQNTLLVDDTMATRLTMAQPEWQVSTDTILSPQSIRLLYGDLTDLLIQPHGVFDEREPWMLQKKTDIMSPWRLELQDQEKYNTWRSILGSVQIGGAAYLGYLYLKKHGLR